MKTIVHDMDIRHEGIEEGIALGIEQGIEQGVRKTIIDLLSRNVITREQACESLKCTDEELKLLLKFG